MEKITWSKLMGSAPSLAPNVIAVVLGCCALEPQSTDVIPDSANQGTSVFATVRGDYLDGYSCGNAPPQVIVDGPYNPGSDGVRADPVAASNYTQYGASFTLHIDATARIGIHSIALKTIGGVTDPLEFDVYCAGCPPPPRLLGVVANDPYNFAVIAGGPPVAYQIQGTNFLNNHPQVQIDGPGVSFPPGPYNVQGGGGLDYILLDITADANASPGWHNVRVTTDGGTTNTEPLTVYVLRSPPPSPGPTPYLRTIFSGNLQYPSHITKSASQVSVKFEGTSFGTNSELIMDPNPNNVIQSLGEVSGATSPATDITGLVSFYSPPGTDSSVTVRVHNLDNDTMSNPLVLSLDPPAQGAPVINFAYFLVNGFAVTEIHPNSEADLHINGQNLPGVTDGSFSGIQGLKFSNVVYNFADDFIVHVQADPTTPLSANEATNLTITTSNGPITIWVQILP